MLRLEQSSAADGFARLSLYGGKTLCPANRKLEERALLGLWGREQPWCAWKCPADLRASAAMRGAEQEGSRATAAPGGQRDGAHTATSLQLRRAVRASLRALLHTSVAGALVAVKAARCSECNRSWGSPVGVAGLLLPVSCPALELQVFLSNVLSYCIEWKSVGFPRFRSLCVWLILCLQALHVCVKLLAGNMRSHPNGAVALPPDPTAARRRAAVLLKLVQVLPSARCKQPGESIDVAQAPWVTFWQTPVWQMLKFLWWPVGFGCQAVAGRALGQLLVAALVFCQLRGRGCASLRNMEGTVHVCGQKDLGFYDLNCLNVLWKHCHVLWVSACFCWATEMRTVADVTKIKCHHNH